MFKRISPLIVGLSLAFFSTTSAQAHIGGVPFFKINGDYTLTYPIPVVSTPELPIPQDASPTSKYLVNQSLAFEIDTKVLQLPQSVVEHSRFEWDFGDGTTATGLLNNHTYHKPGSYIVTINATTDQNASPQLIESMVLTIVPSADYKLPEVHFEVNHQPVHNPTYDFVMLNAGQEAKFDATESSADSSIRSFDWNFSDGHLDHGPVVTHSLPSDRPITIAMVRVTDANNIFTDSYAQIRIQNSSIPSTAASATPAPVVSTPHLWLAGRKLLLAGLLTGLLLVIVFFYIKGRAQK